MNKSSLHQQAIKLYLGNVKKFCLKKKLVPKVAFNSFRSDKQHIGADIYFKKEFEFYKKYLGNFSYERKSSYKLAAESDVIISMGSNLGYELLSRNFKVFFFIIIQHIYQ